MRLSVLFMPPKLEKTHHGSHLIRYFLSGLGENRSDPSRYVIYLSEVGGERLRLSFETLFTSVDLVKHYMSQLPRYLYQ